MLRQKGVAVKSFSHVLDASFDALGRNKQEKFMTLAVLPKAAVEPMEMLMNLWEIEESVVVFRPHIEHLVFFRSTPSSWCIC